MKLLFTSDLHGNSSHYERLRFVVELEKPDVIILGGDLLPDDSALDAKRLGTGQPKYIRGAFRNVVTDLRKASGCDEVLVIFGNHDWGSAVDAMGELSSDGLLKVLTPKDAIQVGGVNFLGYSCTPPTPWFVKDFERLDRPGDEPPLMGGARWRISRMTQLGAGTLFDGVPTIQEELAAVTAPASPWVFVVHAPPYATKLDQSYQGESWGSHSVRVALERLQPMLSLHGHIHESPDVSGDFKDMLGATTAVNPGQSVKVLCYAVVDIDVAGARITNLRRGRQP
ncbi:MAG: metallophosphoesterase [Phycisphaerales bacterium]|nr:metallophosphoesterase [Phycisphaerales bacterium]MCB9858051.1 metallophosphoesterase [Phycisphaerales bacterium]MCB9864148.1 metallophosphoesterase [Phycisphaerales bacterium]